MRFPRRLNLRRKLPRIFRANCLVLILSLWLRGRLKYLLLKQGFHCMGITRNGNLIHFAALDRDLPWYRKLYFKGRFEVIRPEFLKKRMAKCTST